MTVQNVPLLPAPSQLNIDCNSPLSKCVRKRHKNNEMTEICPEAIKQSQKNDRLLGAVYKPEDRLGRVRIKLKHHTITHSHKREGG